MTVTPHEPDDACPFTDGLYNAFLEQCPTRQLLDELGNKWSCLVLVALSRGPLRHGELRRALAGVSQKMLTQTLRTLERDGLITRSVTASVPVRVDYELTPLGADLRAVVQQIKVWAEANMGAVAQARSAYDAEVA
jgi:DNA-binding HxlR family transcriptional regulator